MRFERQKIGCSLAVLAALLPSMGMAQRGVVFGTFLDTGGNPLRWQTVRFPGATIRPLTDERGHYRVEVVPGRYQVVGRAPSGEKASQEILVRAGEKTMVDVREGNAPEPRYWGVSAGNIEEIKPSGKDVPADSTRIEYHPQIGPVNGGPLSLSVRYELVPFADSVRVNVIAEGVNNEKDTASVCGCFSFWSTQFVPGPECLGDIPLAPVPGWMNGSPHVAVAPEECTGSTFDGQSTRLAPGKSITRRMTFTFRPEDFRVKTGELHIHTFFFSGKPGQAWEDVKRVHLGVLAVPIRPPGMPARYKT